MCSKRGIVKSRIVPPQSLRDRSPSKLRDPENSSSTNLLGEVGEARQGAECKGSEHLGLVLDNLVCRHAVSVDMANIERSRLEAIQFVAYSMSKPRSSQRRVRRRSSSSYAGTSMKMAEIKQQPETRPGLLIQQQVIAFNQDEACFG